MNKVGLWLTAGDKRNFILNFKTNTYTAQNSSSTYTSCYESIILDSHLSLKSTYSTQFGNVKTMIKGEAETMI